MRRTSAFPYPVCHMAHVAGATNAPTAVWICEYPYRTMRMSGPSKECSECPVWQAMHLRADNADEATADSLLAS